MTEQQWMETLKKDDYRNLTVCTNPPNTDFGTHTHHEQTVHVILKGTLTLVEHNESKTLCTGDRFEIPSGTTHHASCGPDGCTMIVGIK